MLIGDSSVILTLKTFPPSSNEVVRTSTFGGLVSFLNWICSDWGGADAGGWAGGGIGKAWELARCSFFMAEITIKKHKSQKTANLMPMDVPNIVLERSILMKLTIAPMHNQINSKNILARWNSR